MMKSVYQHPELVVFSGAELFTLGVNDSKESDAMLFDWENDSL